MSLRKGFIALLPLCKDLEIPLPCSPSGVGPRVKMEQGRGTADELQIRCLAATTSFCRRAKR